ncbi:MAG: PilN domain-containing protein [Candidatus Omnitrophota bacterium]
MGENILIIPRHKVFVRFLEVPSVDDNEIKSMVELQAIKEIPYSKEEMIIRSRKFPLVKEGFTSLMVVIAKKSIIEELLESETGEGVSVENIKLYTELLYESLLSQGAIKKDKVDLILQVSKKNLEVLIADKERIVFSRGFKNIDRLAGEVDRSIVSYEREKGSSAIDNIIIRFKKGVDIESSKAYLKEHFKDVPIGLYEYDIDLANLDLSTQINLIPEAFTKKKKDTQKKKELAVVYSLLGVFLILFFSFLSFRLYEKDKVLKLLSEKVGLLEKKTHNLNTISKKVELFKQHKIKGEYIVSVLKKTYELVPSNTTIVGLEHKGGEVISYKGISKDTSAVFEFVKKLEESRYFSKVSVKYASKKRLRGQEITDFDIECNIDLKNGQDKI